MIGERLKSERERLGLAQPAFAEIASTTKRTVIEWEKGNTSPSATQLAALAGVGVDVLYVVTGQRSVALALAETLPARQRALLQNYEAADDAGRRIIEGAADLAAQSKMKRVKAA